MFGDPPSSACYQGSSFVGLDIIGVRVVLASSENGPAFCNAGFRNTKRQSPVKNGRSVIYLIAVLSSLKGLECLYDGMLSQRRWAIFSEVPVTHRKL